MSESVPTDEPETDKTQLIISKLVRISKTANEKYPSATDYRYFCSYPSFTEQSNNLSNNVLTLLNKLCNFANPTNNKIDLLSENNEYLRWQTISDSADYCMEQVDMCLDQIKEQQTHNQSLSNGHNSNYNNSNRSSSNKKQNKLFANETTNNNALEILYPQRAFLNTIDNKRNTPFKPNLINGKTNSQRPLNLKLIEDDNDNNIKYYENPYSYEINNINYSPQQLQYCKDELLLPSNISDSLFYWIDNENNLKEMCDYISMHCNEIGIDLEHHHKYTFYGMTCLIQISIGNGDDIRDYIIDVLALKECIHIYLNPIFTNGKIVKILHGSINDILWLQRDFSIYIVNLFDTFEAAKLLNLKEKSLKYLLKQYCNIDTNKYLRKSDWRIRPLTPQLIEYARKDTHYLLYIYKYLTNKLSEKSNANMDLLKECYNNSEKLCLFTYKKACFNVNGWQRLCQYNGWYFINNKSLNVLSKLYEWRDRIGRDLDQSIDVVLSNRSLRQICNDLPTENLNGKKYNLSVIARKYSKDILNIINDCVKDDTNTIDVMFEVNEMKEDKKECDLNEICKSNDGCFGDILDKKCIKIDSNFSKVLDMENENKNYSKSFFPMDNNNGCYDGQNIADNVFKEILNEPVFYEKYDGENMNKKKKKKKLKVKGKESKNKNTNKSKQKRNNMDRVATADDRHKIFGSRYLDINSKKDVFKLPRGNNNDNKKRKGNNNDFDGPILENMQPKKKRKISQVERKQKRLERDKQEKRMNQTNVVENEWPIKEDEIEDRNMDYGQNENENENDNNNRNTNNKCEEDDDVEITETDILDAAPVPVLDTKFHDVYDPFKQ